MPLLESHGIFLTIKREDEIHPLISGNKFRKLKYNLKEAKALGQNTLLTFGGAFSNHIAATACVGREKGFRTIGVIRGEELATTWKQNPTLRLAESNGMLLHFVDRESYRKKSEVHFQDGLRMPYDDFYLLPEGGTNTLAVKGCEAILTESDARFDIIATAVGTGGTIAGLINSAMPHQKVLGFSSLRGDFLKKDIRKFATNSNWELIKDYNFGGYAKVNKELIDFINAFKAKMDIPLDAIYTGKMVYGILDMVKKGEWKPGIRILAIHTGGLQGNIGMNTVLKKKNLPLIDL
ncbi:MAG: 1-aminocyclopropane-1-carboxylate deaminase/D-cysteine desulfhydrase [Croceivirga sp.]